MKQFLAVTVLMALAATLMGCETVKGMGRDLQKAGQAIEGAAR